MNNLSLIICTINRFIEPINLLNSLEKQTNKSFNIIIIDQNKDDKLKKIITSEYSSFNLNYIHDDKLKGLSQARNKGISVNKCKYLAFPDDDCTYSVDLIHKVLSILDKENPLILSIPINNDQDQRIILKKTKDKNLNIFNFWSSACSSSIFIKNDNRIIFDQNFGVGCQTIFQSGEDSDYIYKYIHLNPKEKKIFRNIDGICHPEIKYDIFKTISYAIGKGGVIKKNKLFHFLIIDLIKYIAKLIFILFNFKKFKIAHNHFIGVLKGFIKYK